MNVIVMALLILRRRRCVMADLVVVVRPRGDPLLRRPVARTTLRNITRMTGAAITGMDVAEVKVKVNLRRRRRGTDSLLAVVVGTVTVMTGSNVTETVAKVLTTCHPHATT